MARTMDAAAQAAIRDYDVYKADLKAEGIRHRKHSRPLHAHRVWNAVRIVHRARLAEELDPEPRT